MNALLAASGTVDLARLQQRIIALTRNPSDDPTLATLLIAIAAIAFTLVVLIVLIFATPSRKKVIKVRRYRGTPPPRPVPAAATASGTAKRRPPSRAFLALTSPAAIGIVVLLAFVVPYALTSTNSYCARTCHANREDVVSAVKRDHSSCRSCHEGNIVLAAPANAAGRIRMVVRQSIESPDRFDSQAVDSSACLGCHDSVSREVVTSSAIRMSHREVIDAAIPCTECHRQVGHGPSKTATMSDCITCHDGKTASTTCTVCHLKDPVSKSVATDKTGKVIGTGSFTYPAVRAAKRDCGACHDVVAECDGCHGIRMPHSRSFKEGAHARPAAFAGKLKCWNCHDPVECGACHSGGFDTFTGRSTHGPGWESEHSSAGWDAGCVCHTQRSARKDPICYRCHAKDHSLLPIRP